MSTKNIFSTLFVLAVVSGSVGVLADKPLAHDHQKSKGTMVSSAQKNDDASENCTSIGAEETADGGQSTTTNSKDSMDSKDSKIKCEPKKPSDQNHDHGKMKNQL